MSTHESDTDSLLDGDARRQAAYLAIGRYAALAVLPLPGSSRPPFLLSFEIS
ncbi:hypothetical protein GCM10022254_43650 [Actinomadura meridiana]|uniref:Uncharacterized protein n=1 Tax=Actinomadura meridiana TaxID=559626 RepID=A0ABP8C9K9_9ACTN